ncbi:transglutaminase family protein [Pseudooceanicola sediminis]|uniref:Transglutaminase family protein n=1 Tax=Pseudooceanicola sediminis TaxID=2211117 RepID=A0A399J5Q5_9RHOB|nr:transglutaminase family protein [Pseudooceanicola sediminis]KAA2314236.1 transglutaminase family protein [Puniceibacterium sp. HSS470]RII39907.1 transglutaminase family protein [Pseudooceanicola sediminis]|tara:strand:+ start:65381 stop:66259 length:879 start_codon:yes stop_codon:yes gene_type:complete
MIYSIRLRISYAYERPADVGRHLLRLLPISLPGVQIVHDARLAFQPRPSEVINRRDFFGNECTEIAYVDRQERTEFEMLARVERLELTPRLDVSPRRRDFEAEMAGTPSLSPHAPHQFLWSSPRVPRHAGIAAWAAEQARDAETAFATADAICTALHRDMTFDAKATLVDTPIARAFELRRGVCQDFTHIAICALRSLGIPAGYVSGFLRTLPPKGKERLEGADAMHAWVRAWCGNEMGWVEFDPTNAMLAGTDHVVIGYGRDYFDVSPVKGALRFTGGRSTKQAVDVVEAT